MKAAFHPLTSGMECDSEWCLGGVINPPQKEEKKGKLESECVGE